MSYADDLAKDRHKYLLQRNQLLSALEAVIENPGPKNIAQARELIRKIESSDTLANAVEAMLKE